MNIETLLSPETGAFLLKAKPGSDTFSLMREAAIASKTPVLFNANERGIQNLNFEGAQNPSIIVLELNEVETLAGCFSILRPGTVVFVERFDLMTTEKPLCEGGGWGTLRFLLGEAKDHKLRLILNEHTHRLDEAAEQPRLVSVADLFS